MTPHGVLIRCDGYPEMGLGHLVRCLALAEELRASGPVSFATRGKTLGAAQARAAGYQVLESDGPLDAGAEGRWFREVVEGSGAGTVVVDVRNDLARDDLEGVRAAGIRVVVLDDPSDRRLAADAVFFPPIPQVRSWDWSGFRGRLYAGWEWIVLRRQFGDVRRAPPGPRPRVLVAMGGSDPAGLTSRAVRVLAGLPHQMDVVIVAGPGFLHRDALQRDLLRGDPRFSVRESVDDMAGLMASCALALASFGVTAYELAAAGVPAVHLSLTADHARSATALVDAGIAVSLGVHGDVTDERMATAVAALLDDLDRREAMARRARELVDGKGAARVARRVREDDDIRE